MLMAAGSELQTGLLGEGIAPRYSPAVSDFATGGEEERLLLEHLPIVRFLARRIHERLPQHVEMEELISVGVVVLMDAFT